MFSSKELCSLVYTIDSAKVILKPSPTDIVFIKPNINIVVDDRSRAPKSVIIDLPFSKTWSQENLNGYYFHVGDLIYEREALYKATNNEGKVVTTTISLERNGDYWEFKNHLNYDNLTVLAMKNSSAAHPGLLVFDDSLWHEIDLDDSDSLDSFPELRNIEPSYAPLLIRYV